MEWWWIIFMPDVQAHLPPRSGWRLSAARLVCAGHGARRKWGPGPPCKYQNMKMKKPPSEANAGKGNQPGREWPGETRDDGQEPGKRRHSMSHGTVNPPWRNRRLAGIPAATPRSFGRRRRARWPRFPAPRRDEAPRVPARNRGTRRRWS